MTILTHNPLLSCLQGERYTAMAPDTLDLAGRMGLAINALTNVWNPQENWALYFLVDFAHRPPILHPSGLMDAWLNIPPKFLEALTVCRLASGSDQNVDRDYEVWKNQLSLIGADGFGYMPSGNLVQYAEPRGNAYVWAEGRMLLALSMLAQADDDPLWINLAKRKVDRLLSLTKEKEGFRFLTKHPWMPGETPAPEAGEPVPGVGIDIWLVGAAGHGAGLFSRVADYEPALELSGGLARWALARLFNNPDGRYRVGHFHGRLYGLMAVCEYGYAANDRAVLERVDACYRWVREMGDPLIGYYTEHMPGTTEYLGTSGGNLDDMRTRINIPWDERWKRFAGNQGNTVETCEVADIVWLALYLTRAGIGDYWDDVDRWMRNVYAEAQMRDTSFLEHIPDGYFTAEPSTVLYQDAHNVAERSVGSFWGWQRANDGLNIFRTPIGPKIYDHSIMHCCTGNGARTMYLVWDSIVTQAADEVHVNLLLNRAAPWLGVDSYLPVEGKVVLHIKDAPKVAIRLPEWCAARDVQVRVGEAARRGVVSGQWLRLGGLKRGDTVTLTFPVPEQVLHRVIGEMPYRLTMRGSNVVAIDPKGQGYPLYENQPTGKLVRTEHFLARKHNIIW